MSRGRGGGGRGRGRGGFGGGALPPMGLTFADLQSLSREATAMYPPIRPPVLSEFSEDEKKICQYQLDYIARLHKSHYFVVEPTKSTELPRYSDKYKPSVAKQPTLKRTDLHAPFFPPDILESYFNPRRKRKARPVPTTARKRMNIDELNEDDEDQEKDQEEGSDIGSQPPSDYDVDEEYDNDYAENYFDNGEGDDMDDVGGGDDGGGGDYD